MKISWFLAAALIFLNPGKGLTLERIQLEDSVALDRVPEVVVPGGHSVVLSFKNNQFIQSVWLDDPSILTLTTDRQLCIGGAIDIEQCGFSQFIRLTMVNRASAVNAPLVELNGPSFSSGGGESTLLTVITTDGAGMNRQVYQFTVVTTLIRTPNISLVEIVPSRQGLTIAAIKNGAVFALANGSADRRSDDWQRLELFVELVEARGRSISSAIRESNVSVQLLNYLQELGSGSRYQFSPVLSLEEAR